jgi:D-glycero-D-manno-heptose 1,7-bisphosphate phosphatase
VSLWIPRGSPLPAAPPDRPRPAPRLLFLDRDGVIIVDAHYLHDPDGVRLLPGAADALRRAGAAGFTLVGLSNQSGIGRGYYTEAQFAAVQARVDAELAAAGTGLAALFYCPHAPEAGCRCRKPAPGLLAEASRWFVWPAGGAWLVGDKASDVELARRAGVRALLVRTGKGRAEEAAARAADPAAAVVDDLAAAVALAVAEAGT